MISDAHTGLKAAIARVVEATWQRCRVDWIRNALAHVSRSQHTVVAAAIRQAFDQPGRAHAGETWCKLAEQLRPRWPRLADLDCMSRPIPPAYKTRNWPAYNEALKRRGSLTIWFDPAMTWEATPTGKRGPQPDYSDAAIQTCLTMKVLFGMALRQTTGFVECLLGLIGLDWAVPNFSTLSRRQ